MNKPVSSNAIVAQDTGKNDLPLGPLPTRELTAEQLAPYANYSSYRLRFFARNGIIRSCRQDPERRNAWVFQPAAVLAEIESLHQQTKAIPISVLKSPRKKAS